MDSKSENLSILSGHYKDTFEIIEKMIKTRDKSFALIFVLLFLMSLQMFSPIESEGILRQLIKAKLGIDAGISITVLNSLIWFGLLAVVIRYFQTVINLEKLYNYIHLLEDQLSKNFEGVAFTREGKNYLKKYPKFLDCLHIIYRKVFPSSLVLAISVKLYFEYLSVGKFSIPIVVDVLAYLLLFIATLLYMFDINFKKKN